MTEHVRTRYRSHRKAMWALVLGLAALIAAVVIPLAMAADKTYKMTVSSPVCAGSASTTVITLNNTSSSQTLGSAEIYFPRNTVASAPPGSISPNPTSTTSPPGNWDILQLNNLDIARRSSRDITVTLKPNVTFSAVIQAVVKQSNEFNDTQGGANLFSPEGSFPTLRVVNCVTVTGRVYQDRNLDNTYTTGTGAFLNSDVPKAWTVKLFAKDVGATSYPPTPLATTTSSATNNGAYIFSQVPAGSDYKICVAAAGTDASSKWALQTPAGNTACGPISTGGPSSSAANNLPNLSANAIGPAPGQKCQPATTAACTDFQVVPVVGPFGAGDTSTVGGYQVIGGANPDSKPDDFYVQDTWVDDAGRTNFRFSPVAACAAPQDCSKHIYLLEQLTADVKLSDLSGQQATLQYDDVPAFLDGDLKPMPYCLIDPRMSGGALATSGVLGKNFDNTDATSCIVEGQQSVTAGTGKVHVVYVVYTAYDGGRQVG